MLYIVQTVKPLEGLILGDINKNLTYSSIVFYHSTYTLLQCGSTGLLGLVRDAKLQFNDHCLKVEPGKGSESPVPSIFY